MEEAEKPRLNETPLSSRWFWPQLFFRFLLWNSCFKSAARSSGTKIKVYLCINMVNLVSVGCVVKSQWRSAEVPQAACLIILDSQILQPWGENWGLPPPKHNKALIKNQLRRLRLFQAPDIEDFSSGKETRFWEKFLGKTAKVQHFSWFQSTLAVFPLKMCTKLWLYFTNIETTEFWIAVFPLNKKCNQKIQINC